MNPTNHGFGASLFHPDLGPEPVGGLLLVGRTQLEFESESFSCAIPISQLEVEFEEGGKGMYFCDAGRPEIRIYAVDAKILRYPSIRTQPQVAAELQRRELWRSLRLTLYFGFGCAAVIWLGSLMLGMMAGVIVDRAPLSWDKRIGMGAIENLQKKGELLDDSNDVAQLTTLAAPLMQALPADRRELKFYIASNSEPNAFALPGGSVVVNSSLLQLLDKPDEVVGVLAHELAHQVKRHVIRRYVAATGPLVIFGLFLHSDNGMGNLMAAGSGLMIFQDYSQAYETEADETGWNYLVAANIDPSAMIRALQKLEEREEARGGGAYGPQALQSHPATAQRIARLQAKWDKLPRKTGFIELPPVKWTVATNGGG